MRLLDGIGDFFEFAKKGLVELSKFRLFSLDFTGLGFIGPGFIDLSFISIKPHRLQSFLGLNVKKTL